MINIPSDWMVGQEGREYLPPIADRLANNFGVALKLAQTIYDAHFTGPQATFDQLYARTGASRPDRNLNSLIRRGRASTLDPSQRVRLLNDLATPHNLLPVEFALLGNINPYDVLRAQQARELIKEIPGLEQLWQQTLIHADTTVGMCMDEGIRLEQIGPVACQEAMVQAAKNLLMQEDSRRSSPQSLRDIVHSLVLVPEYVMNDLKNERVFECILKKFGPILIPGYEEHPIKFDSRLKKRTKDKAHTLAMQRVDALYRARTNMDNQPTIGASIYLPEDEKRKLCL